jgi:hypothetical protein
MVAAGGDQFLKESWEFKAVGCGEYSNRIDRDRCGSYVATSYGHLRLSLQVLELA